MGIKLWELAGEDSARRFSPYCWRARMALWHKGLSFETVPWRFTDTDAIAFSGQGAVPVLVDGERVVSNSWDIAVHLEEAYSDKPSLFGGDVGRALCSFVNDWADRTLGPQLAPVLAKDILGIAHPKDREYYRRTREQRYGRTLEAAAADRDATFQKIRTETLAALRTTLADQPFLGGSAPIYADHAVFGTFQWARIVCATPLLTPDDPIFAWRSRLLDLHGGAARALPAYGD